MRIILLQDIKGVGRQFEEKDVSDGYAMNFLIPQKLALLADKAGHAKAQQLKAQSEGKKAEKEERLKEKQTKREEKREALEKFRQEQKEPSS